MSDKGNDLISRCKLFNALAPVQTLGEAYGVIQGMDTVDAVPVRHGRWIQVSQDRANCNRCNCESGKMIKQGERYFPKFCPECGADMREDGGND